MKTPLHSFSTASLAVLFLACTGALNADVTLRQQSSSTDKAWPKSYADGTLAASARVVDGTNKAIQHEFLEGDAFAQSILGNDEVLKAFAFQATIPGSLEYVLTVLDYGASGAIDTRAKFNPKTAPAVAVKATLTLTKTSSAKLYFVFTGQDAILLKKGHGYVFMIASKDEGGAKFYRLTDGTSYPQGACAKGPGDLNPQAFSASGETRDALFALYTAKPAGDAK